MTFTPLAWLVLVFPMLAFLFLTAAGRSSRLTGVYAGVAGTLLSFILAVLVFIERLGNHGDYTWNELKWLSIGDFSLYMGFEVTNLNALMLIVVTFVSLLVQIYSSGYMKGDERISVFYAYLSLFTFSMLGLVLSPNLVQLYIFWELVGVCSFLLIGFWYERPEAKAAAKKAFIVTRIGDVGLLIAILLLYVYMPGNSLDFASIHNAFQGTLAIPPETVTWIAVLIFIGAIGKSGQFPLHTWLPDAMEGPTPVSALIHAATMVAAGVYLVARTYDIFLASETALTLVLVVGAFTALFAATIGTAQNDIKRILAYSTISQLGYMMMALGLGTWLAYTAGIFHLFTHAFFKALLFLAAGSVIHAVHTQNIHDMGGLGRKMKVTAWTFAIGTLALSGIFPLSGFWSKDAILAEAYHQNQLAFWVGMVAAFFTAFYMSRLFFLVFAGKGGPYTQGREIHESPASMSVPLVVLAVLAVGAGFVFIPGMNPWFGDWLTDGHAAEESLNGLVVLLSTAVSLLGIGLGWYLFGSAGKFRVQPDGANFWLVSLVRNKFYIDEIYQAVIVTPLKAIAWVLQRIDDYIVDGAVRLVAAVAMGTGKLTNRLQNGQIQTYGLVTLLGLVVLILAFAGRRFFHVG